jgi:hypothetical protein
MVQKKHKKIYSTIKQALAEDLILLTYARLKLDEANDLVDISQDIQDLYLFPERLLGSYQAEWLRYCLPKIAAGANVAFDDEQSFFVWLDEQSSPHTQMTIDQLIITVKQCTENQNNLVPFPTPLRKYIVNLINL